ncbi:MAG: TRAP transporter small permease [Pseudomonadota bacterium]
MSVVRRALDALYYGAGVLAALCLISILTLIVLQMLARWTGEVFPGAPDYAGYAMAAASFLAFAHALNRGAHIRVSIVLNALPDGARRWLEVWCFAIGTAVAWYFVWFGTKFVYWSWKFGDISQGQDATPLWIPQAVMLAGAVILAIALTDSLIGLITGGRHRIQQHTMGE